MDTSTISRLLLKRDGAEYPQPDRPEKNVVEQQLELDRVRLTNIHNTNLQRLNYSLEVANAAGIKKPVYSNGQAVKMTRITPLRSALTVSRKSCRSKNLKDVTELNAEFQNREYYLAQLKKLSFADVKLEPFRYQLSPSMPVKRMARARL